MFNDYIELKKQEMIDNLMKLVAIPSVASAPSDGMPFGRNVNEALEKVTALAKDMGFKAKNLGSCAEISFGQSKGPKVYIAGHVDIVPPGDGWTNSPYQLTIRDSKMFGRGVLDDKGPSIAVLYALKAVKELGYKPKAHIKLILGGNEENGMSDLQDYINKAGLPDFALTPDSSFPIINAEAGVLQGTFYAENIISCGDVSLISFNGGNAFNSVPDVCRAVLSVPQSYQSDIKGLLSESELQNKDFEYDFSKEKLCITVYGVSAHGSVPEKGKNACVKAAEIISAVLEKTGSKNGYIEFIKKYFSGDTEGRKLGIACEDSILGKLSLNVGICNYEEKTVSVDMRLPINAAADSIEKRISEIAESENMAYKREDLLESTHVPEDSEFLQKLAKSYETITGKQSKFIAARGATYAKCFKGKGVAFGPIDEENPEEGGNMHSADEYLSVEAFLNLAKIYALAIYELWVKDN